MLFKTEFRFRDPSEENSRRALAVFAAWQPPDEMDIQGFYSYGDGSGGFTIADVPDAATGLRAVAPFAPWLDFEVTPILTIEEGTANWRRGHGVRDGVS